MINKETLNKYIAGEDNKELTESILLDAYEMISHLQNELDALAENAALHSEIEETGKIPEDLGAAIVKIKENAEKGDAKAAECISKIQNAFNI